MQEYDPAAYPPPPSRAPGLGCYAKGCLTVLAVCLILGIMLGGSLWYVWRNVTPFVTDRPAAIRIFPATEEQYQAVRAKIAPFVQQVNSGQGGTLALSADDFNILVARDPQYTDLRGRAYVTISHDQLTTEASFPLNDPSLGQQRVFFSGRITFDASYAGGDFTFVPRRVEPLNGDPTPSTLAWLIGQPNFSRNFSRGFTDSFHETLNKKNPDGATFFGRLHTMIVKDNEIVITAPGSPVAAPANPP